MALTRKQFSDDLNQYFSEAVESAYKDLIEAAVKAEREACAKVCEERFTRQDSAAYHDAAGWCAIAIRARGEGK